MGVTRSLDSYIRRLFSANLKEAAEANFPVIPDAMTACGYITIFCSVTRVKETSYTAQNGVKVENTWQHSNLEALFRDFCVCRLRELIEQVMDAARTVVTNQNQQFCANAYAASAILYYELKTFKEKLDHGHLRNLVSQYFEFLIDIEIFTDFAKVPKTLKRLLVNWFGSLIDELLQRLREGCGRYPYWRCAIEGPLESLRRRDETYKMHLWLQKNEWIYGSSLPPAPNVPPPPPPQLAPSTWVAKFHTAFTMTPNIIVGADGRLSYVDPGRWYYNPATGQAGPSTSLLDTRNDSYYGHYSGQYPF